ncbi:MAG: autotransporter-associated beta strand repeat-containing protein [Chthoniobacterales bacterium]|nr:autotransporter-associated beta strand repeat-containing protein [Chthoniobacterales bacterium]
MISFPVAYLSASLVLVSATFALGDTQYWGGPTSSGTGTPVGGTATWTPTVTRWTAKNYSGQGGGGYGPWTNGNTSVFGGNAGTVNIGGSYVFERFLVETSGYIFEFGGPRTLELREFGGSGLATATFRPSSAASRTLTLSVTGSTGLTALLSDNTNGTSRLSLTKQGSGTLMLSRDNTYTGNTLVNEGTLRISGTLSSTNLQVSAGAVLEVNGNSPLSVPGTVTFAPGSGLRLPAEHAGINVIALQASGIQGTPSLTGVPGYELTNHAGTSLVLVASTRTAPVLDWQPTPLGTIIYGTRALPSTLLTATANIPGTFNYALTTGTEVAPGEILGVGTNRLVATFTSDDTNSHLSGHSITNSVIVAKSAQSINFAPLPQKTEGAPPFSLRATASSALAVSYTSSDTNVASISGLSSFLVTINGPGTTVITASQDGDASYHTAANVSRTLVVLPQPAPAAGFDATFPGQSPADDPDRDGIGSLVAYGLGSDGTLRPLPHPAPAMSPDGMLSVTAVVRINDPDVEVFGLVSTNLSTWLGNRIIGVPAEDQSGSVPGATERRIFSTRRGTASQKFLQLAARRLASGNAATPILNARIVFLGDSLTSNNGLLGPSRGYYHWTDVLQQRFNLTVTNLGKGGSYAYAGYDRLYENLVTDGNRPDFVLINFGMNDHKIYEKNGLPVMDTAKFEDDLTRIVTLTRSVGSIPILVTPHAIFEGGKGWPRSYYEKYDPALFSQDGGALMRFDTFMEATRRVAYSQNVALIDLRQASDDYDRSAYTIDGVHLSRLGHQMYGDVIGDFLAEQFPR